MKMRSFRAPWWVLVWVETKRVAAEVLAGLGFAGILLIVGIVGAIA